MTDQEFTESLHLGDDIGAADVADGSSVLTAVKDHEQVIAEAIDIIDNALTTLFQRELMSASEVADLLLDMRSLLADRRD